jgi:hypothetical protein
VSSKFLLLTEQSRKVGNIPACKKFRSKEGGGKDVKAVGFSETHTAVKFVLPLAKR